MSSQFESDAYLGILYLSDPCPHTYRPGTSRRTWTIDHCGRRATHTHTQQQHPRSSSVLWCVLRARPQGHSLFGLSHRECCAASWAHACATRTLAMRTHARAFGEVNVCVYKCIVCALGSSKPAAVIVMCVCVSVCTRFLP